MLGLTEWTCVYDWIYLQMQGIFLYTAANKEVRWKHETTWNEKILECTGTEKEGASTNDIASSQGMD
jgi:hypothetical protein